MKKSLIFILPVIFFIFFNILFLPFESEARNIEMVSVDNSGVQGDGNSISPSISADGRYVAFQSGATNLVSGDTNNRNDIFVYDRNTDTIERVSVDDSGVQGNDNSYAPSISADGRYVAFESAATNLVAVDANAHSDVFVYDRVNDTIEMVSVNDSNVQGNDYSVFSIISADGRYVGFYSAATNLVATDTNASDDVFIFDRDTNTIERVSVNDSSVQGNGSSLQPSISSDGRYVAFRSHATNLVTVDTNTAQDVFVYDRDTDTIEMVSVNDSGVQGNSGSVSPSISSDGRYVAFTSIADNLVAGDTNVRFDIFAYDRDTDTIDMVSVDNSGVQGNDDSVSPSISSDGRYVAFYSDATDLVTGDTNGIQDVFVYDRDTDTIERVSVDNSGVQGDDISISPSISSDGYVAFRSDATNLVTGDTNVGSDVFVSYILDTSSPPGGGGGSGGCFISTCRTLE